MSEKICLNREKVRYYAQIRSIKLQQSIRIATSIDETRKIEVSTRKNRVDRVVDDDVDNYYNYQSIVDDY